MYYQTGDVLYKREKQIPKSAKRIKGNLIHKGENHHHLIEGEFELYENDKDLFIKVNEPSRLIHPEHHTIVIPIGIYKKDVVLEYDHFLEESRQVID